MSAEQRAKALAAARAANIIIENELPEDSPPLLSLLVSLRVSFFAWDNTLIAFQLRTDDK